MNLLLRVKESIYETTMTRNQVLDIMKACALKLDDDADSHIDYDVVDTDKMLPSDMINIIESGLSTVKEEVFNYSTPSTEVVFRKFPEWDVIALFPKMKEWEETIGSYQHIWQHWGAHIDLIDELEEATHIEYADLYHELSDVVWYRLLVK